MFIQSREYLTRELRKMEIIARKSNENTRQKYEILYQLKITSPKVSERFSLFLNEDSRFLFIPSKQETLVTIRYHPG